MTTGFRFLGTTDEQTECDRCGRTELRSTVILVALDADGNDVEAVHYGTSCAARALKETGVKMTGAQVLNAARSAHTVTVNAALDARRTLDFYGDVENDDDALVARFRDAHRFANWINRTSDAELLVMAREMFARRYAQVAAAERL